MIASATEKQKRVTAQSKLRMQKHRAKTKPILAKFTAEVMEPDAMELDVVLLNHMTTHVDAISGGPQLHPRQHAA